MNTNETRILFVCTGNICRSPLAQAILEQKLADRGGAAGVYVDSCGTTADHLGQQADGRMRRVAASHGILIDHRARRLVHDDLSRFHLIIGMDDGHMRTLSDIAQRVSSPGELRKLLGYLPETRQEHASDVPDPWYGGVEGFERVYDLVDAACEMLADRVIRTSEG